MHKVNSNISNSSITTEIQQIPKSDSTRLKSGILFNSSFDKGHVKDLVSWFLGKYGEKPTINFLEALKTIGFKQATQAGISLGIEDLEIPPEKPTLLTEAHITIHKIEQQSASGSLTSVEKSQCLIDTWNQTSDLLRQNAIHNFRNRNVVNPVYMMAFSGARGNVSQVRQLVAMRGLMADPQGAILEFPIQSNFREGLTITEYLISCYGARKGLVDTALRTATSGYLTRRLVDSAQHAVIAMVDCGTTKTTTLHGSQLNKRLIGRVLGETLMNLNHKTFFRNHIISTNDAKVLSKNYDQISIRSPLTCEAATSVCQFCYGWNLASGKLVQIGEAVGVIAAQSIGEPGTQLTMRTFHTGGVGVFSDQALKPIFSTYKGKIIFNESIPGHFIRTPHGKIVYMIKYIPNNPETIFFKVQSFIPTQREIIIREKDLPPGSLIFVKNGEIIDAKKLIAQASHVKLTKQKLPESSHPVYSNLEGQVFFESMNLLIEKEVSSDFDFSKKTLDLDNRFLLTNQTGLPDTRRMAKIGSFWVFSAYNQHEIHTIPQFLNSGDLVSPNTILFNYKFFSSLQVQFQKINSQLTFGRHNIQIPVKNVKYLKGNYKFNFSDKKQGKIIYHKKDSQTGLLFWYPLQKYNSQNSNFCHVLPLYIETGSKSNTEGEPLSLYNSKGIIFRVCTSQSGKQTCKSNSSQRLIKNYSSNFVKNPSGLINRIEGNFNNYRKLIDETTFFRTNKQNLQVKFFELRKIGWVCLLSNKKTTQFNQLRQRQFFPTGLSLQNALFPKINVSIKYLNKVNLNKFKNLNKNTPNRNWYLASEFIFENDNFLQNKATQRSFSSKEKQFGNNFKFGLIWYSLTQQTTYKQEKTDRYLIKCNTKYISIKNIFLVQKVEECSLPTKHNLRKSWSNFTGKICVKNPQNFLFSKQKATPLEVKRIISPTLQNYTPTQSGWFSSENLLRISCSLKKNLVFPNTSLIYTNLINTLSLGLSIYQYQYATFNDIQKFSFKTYINNWVLPFKPFTSGTVKIKTSGEFRYNVQKTNGTFVSILRTNDLLTLQNSSSNYTQIGNLIRWGEELKPGIKNDSTKVFVPGTASDHNGQILKINKNSVTLRLGMPILASAHGIVHVFQNDLVLKNQLLITLKSRRLQTEDIVQGIPKIEQLFEARESQGGEILSDTVHIHLRNAFLRELELLQHEHWSTAVEKSFLEAQQFLVENIVEAYGNQGVKISEKHVEVIVRQMTNRVRILESGETGLLPGELVQHSWIKKFNKHIRENGLREATYEPIVLGISKSVLQSESFLLAASFQEVSRVLVKSALSKKRDFLRGLHENVIVGQLIPAGTGLLSQFNNAQLNAKTTLF